MDQFKIYRASPFVLVLSPLVLVFSIGSYVFDLVHTNNFLSFLINVIFSILVLTPPLFYKVRVDEEGIGVSFLFTSSKHMKWSEIAKVTAVDGFVHFIDIHLTQDTKKRNIRLGIFNSSKALAEILNTIKVKAPQVDWGIGVQSLKKKLKIDW